MKGASSTMPGGMALEFLEAGLFKAATMWGSSGSGRDDVAAALQFLGLLQALDLNLAPMSLAPWPHLSSTAARPAFRWRIPGRPSRPSSRWPGRHDVAVAVAPSPGKSLTRLDMSGECRTRPFLISSLVHGADVSPMVRMQPLMAVRWPGLPSCSGHVWWSPGRGRRGAASA